MVKELWKMIKNEEYKGLIWDLKTKKSNQLFDSYDFSQTDFNSAIFENVTFKDCIFYKSNLTGSKIFYDSNFENCIFKDINLSNSTIGSHKGPYKNCLFEKCNFKGKEFNFTEFTDCEFKRTNFNNVNFNGSKFKNCKFSSKFNNVSFNGLYDTNPSKNACVEKVDFSEAIFEEYVSFYNCDLSTCVPPKGKTFEEILYQIYSNDSTVLSTGSTDRIILIR